MLHISQKQAFANRRIHRSPGDVCFDLINVLLLTVFTLSVPVLLPVYQHDQ